MVLRCPNRSGCEGYACPLMEESVDPPDLGYKKQLAQGLREWREEKALSQKDAGAKLGVSAAAISAWECQRSWPRAAQRETLREELAHVRHVIAAIDSYEDRRRSVVRQAPHTAALWTIEALRPGGDQRAELGDLAGHGYLLDRLRTHLPGLHLSDVGPDASERPAGEVRRLVETGRQDEVACVFALHEYGVRSVLSLDDGPRDRYPRNPQTIEAMVLVRARRRTRTGTLAVHFNHRVGAKVPMTRELETIIRGAGLTPRVQAAGTESAIREALLENRVKEYRFVARREPHDRFADDRIKNQEVGRVETRVFPRRQAFLPGGWLLDYFKGRRKMEDFDDLVTFDGKQYDEAKVTVKLANGRTRTVNVLEADQRIGHALTFDLVDTLGTFLSAEIPDDHLVEALHLLLEDQGR